MAADAVFNFTAYVLYTPAIALYGEEVLELDPDSVKFDMQITSWYGSPEYRHQESRLMPFSRPPVVRLTVAADGDAVLCCRKRRPFCSESNTVKAVVKLVTRGSKEAKKHVMKTFKELRDEIKDSADELVETIR